ncbi:hypothetical protein E2P81_ATG08861 [Venturia nashicola]|uniref:Uncharacterized protein n=1 Tax=Venturia nashicola TaxID=86259 RepID=A0A4Z1NJQ1_9PEZI|nr:hypothetical protein E6O75_ATG09059 [Venturia nashicola]TLD23517.1 hypothetical protein E2P81_ATG08861 [Venturia nashicola]
MFETKIICPARASRQPIEKFESQRRSSYGSMRRGNGRSRRAPTILALGNLRSRPVFEALNLRFLKDARAIEDVIDHFEAAVWTKNSDRRCCCKLPVPALDVAC